MSNIKQKKYMDIERLKPAFQDGFEIGDKIVIQEKIDGQISQSDSTERTMSFVLFQEIKSWIV